MNVNGGLDVRSKGQVWTPPDVAAGMARWSARPGRVCVDPACGSGNLLSAVLSMGCEALGVELDAGVNWGGHTAIEGDFLSASVRSALPQQADWVSNPPYLKHHLIPASEKARLHAEAESDGLCMRRTVGVHALFVHRIICSMRDDVDARAALLLPSDLFEGASAAHLLPWMLGRCHLRAVAVLQPEAGVFGSLNTRGVILFMERGGSSSDAAADITWASYGRSQRPFLERWVAAGFTHSLVSSVSRTVGDVFLHGISGCAPPTGLRLLGDLCNVMCGLVAGDASWSLHTSESISRAGLPRDAFRRIIRRAGDVPRGGVLDDAMLDDLDARGVPTWLLDPLPSHMDEKAVVRKLAEGVDMGLPCRPSMLGRNPWWRPAKRMTPPWLASYVGGMEHRFIRNLSTAAPLTGHLCIYPKPGMLDELSSALSRPDAGMHLASIGKSYGTSVKVEPRSLERLPLPDVR